MEANAPARSLRQFELNHHRHVPEVNRESVAMPRVPEYPKQVETHEATLTYPRPLLNAKSSLWLDLFPAVPMSRGSVHDSFVAYFGLRETREIAGLRTLRQLATIDQFVVFFGATWCEALGRWPDLSWMNEYRREHGADAYTAIDAWQEFYALLADGIVPMKIELAFIEHY